MTKLVWKWCDRCTSAAKYRPGEKLCSACGGLLRETPAYPTRERRKT